MARKKKNPPGEPTLDEQIAELVTLAESLDLPDDALDGDLHDAAEEEAELIYEGIVEDTLHEQLKFLAMHGWHLSRLAEMLREAAKNKE